ncbi:tRNA 2-selenouridine(34) synthase MnmH [Helicobacter sp. 13S00477-4]|uniref:tRNA 2-selenouridine(34) synthase MnmH n=1 Tax=Helicobacter sp. 13S00477-4 TaxID=1905759 RepID=UPI000BA5CE3A|nr:tRNA 2-selenouridine(34) synthase MnmH [Helicobacter sp. 13S00477-4]PAF52860.1 tRNA 2-selenouridine(34) synthase MnmH [Helicobacter sp. 13S00477-4]
MKTNFEAFDVIIDVRTPCEYDYSHIPGAINLPVLNNEEYAKIGTIYKQESPLKARIIGAAIACKNISNLLHLLEYDEKLQSILNHKNRFLVYCARGGQRSDSVCTILSHVGFRIQKLSNGYKGYRHNVVDYFSSPMNHFFMTLCGHTGCGKSELIQSQSSWSIDLESLAKHYGSVFGGTACFDNGGQPTQKMFENMLFETLLKKNNENILLIEAESKKLGNIVIPNSLFRAYHQHCVILIEAELSDRIQRIVKMYRNIPEHIFEFGIKKIKPYISNNIFTEVEKLWQKRDLNKIAGILIEKYYDKVYKIPKYSHKIMNKDMMGSVEEILEIKKSIQKTIKSNFH